MHNHDDEMRTGARSNALVSWARVILLNAGIAVALASLVYWVFHDSPAWQYDLEIYRKGVTQLVHGKSLYNNDLGFVYPPFAAIVLVPLALLSATTAAIATLVASITLLEFAIWQFLAWTRWPSRKHRLAASIVLTGAVVWLDPSRTSLVLGQVSFLILAVTTYDLARKDTSPFKGIGVGLMAGFKLIPAVFILYFLVTKRWRAAVVSTLTLLGTVIISIAIVPADTINYWRHIVFESNRIGQAQDVFSESIQSILVRWAKSYDGVTVPYVVLSAFVIFAGLAIARFAFRRNEELLAVAACGAIIVLVLPIAWTFYWVWSLVPLAIRLVQLVAENRSRLAAFFLVLLAVEFYLAPSTVAASRTDGGELKMTVWELLMTSTHALAAVLALVGIAVLVRLEHPRRRTPSNPAARDHPGIPEGTSR